MTEKEQLESLSKKEKAYLNRRVCGWCENTSLGETGCYAVFKKCTESTRIERRKRCLSGYKPRMGKGGITWIN